MPVSIPVGSPSPPRHRRTHATPSLCRLALHTCEAACASAWAQRWEGGRPEQSLGGEDKRGGPPPALSQLGAPLAVPHGLLCITSPLHSHEDTKETEIAKGEAKRGVHPEREAEPQRPSPQNHVPSAACGWPCRVCRRGNATLRPSCAVLEPRLLREPSVPVSKTPPTATALRAVSFSLRFGCTQSLHPLRGWSSLHPSSLLLTPLPAVSSLPLPPSSSISFILLFIYS